MGEALRHACPCLVTLCSRLFGRAKDDVGDNGTNENDDSSQIGSSGKRIEESNVASSPRYTTHSKPSALLPPQSGQSGIYTALWSFEARAKEELSFQAGDLFKVIDRSGEWWTACKVDRNGHTLAEGIVPYNYLARGHSDEAQPWYFGKMNRFEASSHLLAPENSEGAFLIRLSEKDDVGYVLSVKSDNRVKHFKIYKTEEEFHVDQSKRFTSLVDLVEHFKIHPLASVERLGEACARKEPKPQDLSHSTVDEWELPKEEFTLGEQLGSGYFADVHKGKWKNQINVAIKVLKNNDSRPVYIFTIQVITQTKVVFLID
ncbi:hypothetical protein MATL_G00107970 [Megalops atlanticus]|uniref:non-specific protein-tyrosine kinase n=1 Tax=Megalops atlanticus TaxID=7932 RepID=A0A9D3T979_MEGAT|nr:hypothetical protein MATL_G00107970 [Megalops atlanticus]